MTIKPAHRFPLLIAGIAILLVATLLVVRVQKESAPTVAVTIFPVYDIAKQIVGDTLDVALILPPGTSPHTFDPTPSDVKKLRNVETVFTVGHQLDDWALTLVPEDTLVATVDRGIVLFPYKDPDAFYSVKKEDDDEHMEEGDDHHGEDGDDDHDEDGDDHDHGDVDPHYWLDPYNGMTIARTIADTLSNQYPEYADEFQANADAYVALLRDNIETWEELTVDVYDRRFITLHDAFYYLADFTDTTLVATYEPYPGREPAPQYLAALQGVAERAYVEAIFSEPQLSAAGLESFVEDTGLRFGVLDPLGGTDSRVSYIDLIDYNVRTLVEKVRFQ